MTFWTPWKRYRPQIIVTTTKRKEVDTSLSSEYHKALMELKDELVPYLPTAREKAGGKA